MDQSFTPEQSLSLINEMIMRAKNKLSRNSFFFLLWGWLMMFAGIGEYIMLVSGIKYSYIVWPVAGIIGGIGSALYGRKIHGKDSLPNLTDRAVSYLWYGFIITLIIIIVSAVINKINPSPFVLIITGFPTFVTGRLLRFTPLVVGGIVFWTAGVVSLAFMPSIVSLLFSLAIVLGYLVPGYMLRNVEKSATQKEIR